MERRSRDVSKANGVLAECWKTLAETESERQRNRRRKEGKTREGWKERERELTTTTTAMSHHYTPRNKRAARKTPGHQGSPGLEHGSCRAKIIPGRIPVFEM